MQADSVTFVIEASATLAGTRLHRARPQLLTALQKLKTAQRFFVVFYTDQTHPLLSPDNTIELIPAKPRNLGRVTRRDLANSAIELRSLVDELTLAMVGKDRQNT